MKRLIGPVFFLIILAAGYWGWQARPGANGQASAELIPLLSEEELAGFARATEPGAIQFPRDRGAHEEYQTEWWYYTGNLATDEGRLFGFQLTFFRRALTPPQEAGDCPQVGDNGPAGCPTPSNWRANQIYLAHFALSDIAGNRFYQAERFSRGAMGLAGAEAEPYRVWLENWQASEIAPGVVHLYAQSDDVTLDLTLEQTLPPILHGDRGLSPKGPEPGNASYYYSIIRQKTEGRVTVGEKVYEVTGLSWKDHEYSTSALSVGAIGWDWFSLQFDDGTALMFFQIRREDGSLEAASSGSFIHADGTVQRLAREDWQLEVLDEWTSPHSGAVYPAAWRMEIETLDLAIEGRPLMAGQELTVSTIYWEGAVSFSGTRQGQPVSAQGYVEMTGYAETMEGRL